MASLNREWLPRIRIGCVLTLGALLSGCGGGGGDASPPPSGYTVTVSGKITFDRVPFSATLGNGLNPNAATERPARGVIVEAVNGTAVIASATTNENGDYSLSVPANTQIEIRALARMRKTGSGPTWDFRVLNNTNSNRLYALVSSPFSSGAGATRNLRASSGWTGSAYTQDRSAAPFAILDTAYQAVSLILSASQTAAFTPLDFYWSSANRSGTVDQQGDAVLCIDEGDIQTSFYTSGGAPGETDDCGGSIPAGIYVLGSMQIGSGGAVGDTDEFDQHVIAHEFGHYVEDWFARSDSIGGSHGYPDKLDLRVSFGEGWGNAFAAMVLNDSRYRDSYGGIQQDYGFDLEADDPGVEGWFSEDSVSEILWDVFDPANEPGDSVSVGFDQIFAALVQHADTPAFTSIYSFAQALKQAAPSQAAGINALLNAEGIANTDAFGTAETNNGGDTGALPVYRALPLNGGPQLVCVISTNGEYNKLGNNRFFRLDLDAAASVTIDVMRSTGGGGTVMATNPDVFLYRNGQIVASRTSPRGVDERIAQQSLQSGTYIIEVYDYDLVASSPTPRCMTVSATGG